MLITRVIESEWPPTDAKERNAFPVADDLKTINGKEYKNVTVSRVEPDGKNRRKPKSSSKRQSCALRMNVLPK